MQAKDLSDKFILELLFKNIPNWSSHWKEWGPTGLYSLGVDINVPEKVLLAKMRKLQNRGLVDGCPCGCRGDWQITHKGIKFLGHTDCPDGTSGLSI